MAADEEVSSGDAHVELMSECLEKRSKSKFGPEKGNWTSGYETMTAGGQVYDQTLMANVV